MQPAPPPVTPAARPDTVPDSHRTPSGAEARACLGNRVLAFVGMMGAGKSVIGRMTAQAMDLPFVDCDGEIEAVSRMSIGDLFARYGEAEFRALEARVIDRLLRGGPSVLATGGGAFVNAAVRARIDERALTLWLHASLDVLWERVRRHDHRPLLATSDPKASLCALLEARAPVYAEADLTVRSCDRAREAVVGDVLRAIVGYGGKIDARRGESG